MGIKVDHGAGSPCRIEPPSRQPTKPAGLPPPLVVNSSSIVEFGRGQGARVVELLVPAERENGAGAGGEEAARVVVDAFAGQRLQLGMAMPGSPLPAV